MTTLTAKAALVASLLALAGCKDINGAMNIIEGKPEDAKPLALAAFDAPEPDPEPVGPPPEEGIDYLTDWGLRPNGEYYATGWNCTNVPGYRLCAGNMRKPT